MKMSSESPASTFDPETGALSIELPDGGVEIQFGADDPTAEKPDTHFGENLAELLPPEVLAQISADLLEGIEADDMSRKQWLSARARGIDLLGLKLETARSDLGASTAPLEGMSTVRHPLLLDACLRYQANAYGEFLPSKGPLKIEDSGPQTAARDQRAEQLQQAVNRYLRIGAPEYYPDHDRMHFQQGFGGMGFSKGYHCPLRQRPVIETIDGKDIIVSNDATDLATARRVTHVISMPPSTMIRMQLEGAYRDIDLAAPSEHPNQLDSKIGGVTGIKPSQGIRQQDIEYTVYECRADYDIPGYEHEQDGVQTGLPLPYKIVIEKDSREVLEIRRNWREGDERFQKRQDITAFSFVPMFGFYAQGLLSILGNTTNAATTAWRVLLDAGMFSNFPGVLQSRTGDTRTPNNTIRVAPGQAAQVDTGGRPIRDVFMPLPYNPPQPAFMSLVDNIIATGQKVGGVPDTATAEGDAKAPVGTILAQIEQTAITLSAVHKRTHTAYLQEFKLLLELLRERPEVLLEHFEGDASAVWDADAVYQALHDYDFLPASDPNVPSQAHRSAKVALVAQRADAHPDLYDRRETELYILGEMGVADGARFLLPPAPPATASAGPSPEQIKLAQTAIQTQAKLQELQQTAADAAADRQSKEHLEMLKMGERLITHPNAPELLAGAQQAGII
jgi:hypothetical protein